MQKDLEILMQDNIWQSKRSDPERLGRWGGDRGSGPVHSKSV